MPQVSPFAREATPIIRTKIRPFVRAAVPVVKDLAPAARGLARTFPELDRNTKVLNDFVNMLGHNENGREAPDKEGRDEGYLFHLGWLAHQTANLQSVDDAQRADPADLPDGHVLDADEPRQRPAAGRVRARALPAAGDGLQEPRHALAERPALAARERGRPVNTEGPTTGRLLVITGFALTCFCLLLFLWIAFGGPIPLKPQGYRVQVAFTDAPTLATQADVRTAGVKIGRVVKKELAPDGGNRTIATIELESRYAPMKADARAILRQKTLLGETYVEVTTGSPARARHRRGRPPRPTGASPRPSSSTS